MNLAGIVLHPQAEKQLDAFLVAPTHAVLLGGPMGIGKTSIARFMAARILNAPADEIAAHAYYRELAPKNGSINIAQIRELISFFRLKVPGSAELRRAAVLTDADTMGLEAQNALLKILEEPPVDSVLVLTSSRPQNLLQTIRSRVQSLYIAVPDTTRLRDHFEAAGYEKDRVAAALLRAGTNVAEAQRLLGYPTNETDTMLQLVKRALGSGGYERLLLVDSLAKQKEGAAEFVETLFSVAQASLQSAAANGSASLARWKAILQAAYVAQDAFEGNGNAKLVLTELMLAL